MKTRIAFVLIIALAAIVSCTVTRNVEDPPGSGNYKKVAETDPRFTKGLELAEGVGGVFGPINPWHGLVTLAIGTAAGLAEWNKRRKQAQLDAVIAGVDAAGNPEVKKKINEVALIKGVEAQLNKSVKAVTGSSTDQ